MHKKLLFVLGSISTFVFIFLFCRELFFKEKNEYLINHNLNNSVEVLRHNKEVELLADSLGNIEKFMLKRYMLLYLINPKLASNSSIISVAENKIIDIKHDKTYKECLKKGILECKNILFVDEISGVKFFIIMDAKLLAQNYKLGGAQTRIYKSHLNTIGLREVNYKQLFSVVFVLFIIFLIADFKLYQKKSGVKWQRGIKKCNHLYYWEKSLLRGGSLLMEMGLQKIHIKFIHGLHTMNYTNSKAFIELQETLMGILKIITPGSKIFIKFSVDNVLCCEINLSKPMLMIGYNCWKISKNILDTCKYKKKTGVRVESTSNFNGMYFSNIVLREININV